MTPPDFVFSGKDQKCHGPAVPPDVFLMAENTVRFGFDILFNYLFISISARKG